MTDLSLFAVQWCAQHGHPVLVLRAADGQFLVVAMTSDDSAALAASPDPAQLDTAPRRLYRLLEQSWRGLGARLVEARLHVGDDRCLHASLYLAGVAGEVVVPAHFTDAIALARRAGAPMRMADAELTGVAPAPLGVEEPAPETTAPPEVFRSLIASLDLDRLGAAPGGPAAHSPDQAHDPR
jgi:hypothetical protein